MAQAKVNKVGLAGVILWIAFVGVLYYFSYREVWASVFLEAIYGLGLLWMILSPLYVLAQLMVLSFRRKKAAKLGLTLEAYEAQRRSYPPDASGHVVARPSLLQRWSQRLLRIARWELILFTAMLVLFGSLAQHWRQAPGEHVGVTALGMFYALALYGFVGLQVLHRMWAQWHHRLAPGSAPPTQAVRNAPLARGQKLWNLAFCLALVFAVVELALSGSEEAMAVLFSFLAPALALLLLAAIWWMLRPLFRHRHAAAA